MLNSIIIGAGLAGLSAGLQALNNKESFLILESSDKIGGRIQSVEINGAMYDRGASWIHGHIDNPLYKLVEQNQLETIKADYNEYDSRMSLYYGDRLLDDKTARECVAVLNRIVEALDQPGVDEDDQSTFAKVTRLFEKESLPAPRLCEEHATWQSHLLNWLRFRLSIYDGADPVLTSANSQALYKEYEGEQLVMSANFSQILTSFNAVKPFIKTNKRIIEINKKENMFELKAESGQLYQAKKVVVTVPLGVLKNNTINFDPSLPEKKQRAIEQLGFGVMEKLILQFEQPFWPVDKLFLHCVGNNDMDSYFIMVTRSNPYSLCLLLDSDQSKEYKSSADAFLNKLNMSLKKIFVNYQPPLSQYFSSWQTDLNSFGSYTYIPKNIDPAVCAEIAAPIQFDDGCVLQFGGEHANQYEYATAHGALRLL